jgi:hypothetical protein
MLNVGGDRRRVQFPFLHSFGQPLKPLPAGRACRRLAQFLDVALKFPSGLLEGSAIKVIDHLERNLVIENQDAEAFPRREQRRHIDLIRFPATHQSRFWLAHPGGDQ